MTYLRPIARRLQFPGDISSDHHRTMLSAGASERDCEVTLTFPNIMRKQIDQEIRNSIDELDRLRERPDIFCDLWISAGEVLKSGNVVRIGKKSYIEYKITIRGHPV